jgi:hypothetical protein
VDKNEYNGKQQKTYDYDDKTTKTALSKKLIRKV